MDEWCNNLLSHQVHQWMCTNITFMLINFRIGSWSMLIRLIVPRRSYALNGMMIYRSAQTLSAMWLYPENTVKSEIFRCNGSVKQEVLMPVELTSPRLQVPSINRTPFHRSSLVGVVFAACRSYRDIKMLPKVGMEHGRDNFPRFSQAPLYATKHWFFLLLRLFLKSRRRKCGEAMKQKHTK